MPLSKLFCCKHQTIILHPVYLEKIQFSFSVKPQNIFLTFLKMRFVFIKTKDTKKSGRTQHMHCVMDTKTTTFWHRTSLLQTDSQSCSCKHEHIAYCRHRTHRGAHTWSSTEPCSTPNVARSTSFGEIQDNEDSQCILGQPAWASCSFPDKHDLCMNNFKHLNSHSNF